MYEIYNVGLPCVVNESEILRLYQDIADNMGQLKYEVDENKKHCLVFQKYKLILRISDRPTQDERTNPRLQIIAANTMKEGGKINNQLTDQEQKAYTLKISVAINRGPLAIAKAINSRLWKDYITVYAIAQERYLQITAKNDACKQLARGLAGILDSLPNCNQQIHESVNIGLQYGLTVKGQITDHTHSLSLYNVPTHLMKDILELIAKESKESVFEAWVRKIKAEVLYRVNSDLGILHTSEKLLELPPNSYDWRSAYQRGLQKYDICKEMNLLLVKPETTAA